MIKKIGGWLVLVILLTSCNELSNKEWSQSKKDTSDFHTQESSIDIYNAFNFKCSANIVIWKIQLTSKQQAATSVASFKSEREEMQYDQILIGLLFMIVLPICIILFSDFLLKKSTINKSTRRLNILVIVSEYASAMIFSISDTKWLGGPDFILLSIAFFHLALTFLVSLFVFFFFQTKYTNEERFIKRKAYKNSKLDFNVLRLIIVIAVCLLMILSSLLTL